MRNVFGMLGLVTLFIVMAVGGYGAFVNKQPAGYGTVADQEGRPLLRIARHVSEELNGGTMDRVETLEGPAVGMRPLPPPGAPPLTDGS